MNTKEESNQRLKIKFLAAAYPYRGGTALTAAYIYRMLQPHFDIEILNYSLLYPSILFPGKTQFDVSKKSESEIPSKRLISSINPFSWVRTARYINQSNPDLVIFDWWNPFFGMAHYGIGWWLKKEIRNKVITFAHNAISHESRWLDKFLTSYGLAYPKAFLTYSKSVSKDLSNWFPKKKVFETELPVYTNFKSDTPVSPSEARAKLGFTSEHKVLLFFGLIRKYKGLHSLLEAFAGLVKKDENFRLIIAGEFYDKPEPYIEQIQQLGIEKSIVLINQFIANEDVPLYYAASDVTVLPYISATQSGVVSTAFALETPVIVTDVGGLNESVQNEYNGLIVPPNRTDLLAQSIERFYVLRNQIDFKKNIQTHNQSNKFEKLPELIREIVASLKIS